jgi:CYTH domain-containing protein
LCWELDLFERYSNLALLEVELEDEGQEFVVPALFNVIKEVSDDASYSSSALALRNSKIH